LVGKQRRGGKGRPAPGEGPEVGRCGVPAKGRRGRGDGEGGELHCAKRNLFARLIRAKGDRRRGLRGGHGGRRPPLLGKGQAGLGSGAQSGEGKGEDASELERKGLVGSRRGEGETQSAGSARRRRFPCTSPTCTSPYMVACISFYWKRPENNAQLRWFSSLST